MMARKEGYLTAEGKVMSVVGKPAVLRMQLVAAGSSSRVSRDPWPWVVTGVGGAVALAGGVVYGLSFSKFTDADAYLDTTSDYAGYEQRHGDATDLGNAGRITLGVGLAAAAGGLVWALVRGSGADAKTTLHMVPHPGGAGLGFTGTF